MTPSTNGTHSASSTDADLDILYSWVAAPSAPPTPLPEAAFSVTLRGKLDGIETLLTVRGMTAAEFRHNLAQVRGLLDQPQPPSPTQGQGKDWCAVHQTVMQWNAGKEGRKGWYSHRTDQGWCKGK